METFNVIYFDFNAKKFDTYDVIPFFVEEYDSIKKSGYRKVPKTFEEFKKFIESEGRYRFWGRSEYEIILVDWPCQKTEEKWDIFDQIMMNQDIITKLVIKSIKHRKK